MSIERPVVETKELVERLPQIEFEEWWTTQEMFDFTGTLKMTAWNGWLAASKLNAARVEAAERQIGHKAEGPPEAPTPDAADKLVELNRVGSKLWCAQELQNALFAHPQAGAIPVSSGLIEMILSSLRDEYGVDTGTQAQIEEK